MANQKERRATPRTASTRNAASTAASRNAAYAPDPRNAANTPDSRDTASAAAPRTAASAKTAMSNEEIYRLIAETAYFKAKARGFEPGGEVQDWIEAEAEIRQRIDKGNGR